MQEHSTDAEVIIVDNSNKNYGMDSVIINPVNNGYPGGLNLGIKHASGDYIVCCNPDIFVHPEWLEKLSWGINQGYGMVGPMSSFVSGIQNIKLYKQIPSQINMFDVSFVIGFCFMISRESYKETGPFDDQFTFENDDIDYSLRMKSAGFSIGIMPHCFIEHVGHQSAVTNPKSSDLRLESIYKIIKKYPNTNFSALMGSGWHRDWLNEVSRRYPDVKDIKSFKLAVEAQK
jgi:GT2 family glycosyltransferase